MALAALGPALLYYISVFIQVHLVAVRDDLPSMEMEGFPGFRDNLRGAVIFVAPLSVLIYCLFYRFFSPDTSVIYATASLLLVMAVAKPSGLAPRELMRMLQSTGQ